MKRLLIILSAIFSFAGMQAQYLNNGDVVSISFLANDARYYLEASRNGILTQPYPTDDCLWVLGVDQNGNYTLQDLTTGQYLYIKFTDPSNSQLILAQEPTTFSFTNQGSVANQYMHGHLYFSLYYQPWWTTISMYIDSEWGGNGPYFTSHSWANNSIYVEKWEQKGAGKPTGHFSPSKIEFTYAKDEEEAAAQARPVSFEIEATTESYYQCVPRQDEALLRRSTGNIDESQIRITNIYWQSDSVSKSSSVSKLDKNNYVNCPETHGREVLSRSEYTYNEQDKKWQFSITPVGPSPMGLKDKLGTLERWIDYADNVVVEYTYGGGETQKAEMRVVRKSYHGEELPPLSFSINPVTYTFSIGQETKEFDVILTHQHGSVIYNVDNQAVVTTYTYDSVTIPLKDFNHRFEQHTWEKSYQFLNAKQGQHWLTLNEEAFNTDNRIVVTAAANNDQTYSKRSDTLVVTLENTSDFHPHTASFKIPLHQRGKTGGIQFYTQAGKGNDVNDWDPLTDQQQVHTAERTIYYLPNQEIELRLPESGFSGYMRWYDYETGGDPYYNYAHGNEYQSTSWVLSPRAADGNPFSAINTPVSAATVTDEGLSHGLYALNKDKDGNNHNGNDAAIGGILDEGNPYNPMPIIKGWEDGGYHIMACDVSAYTDYNVEVENRQIKSITEPTLSYRQLFHLRPASEMADTLAARSSRGVYLEEYKYQAPAGKQILLSTEYRHSKVRSHKSELCYFYRDNSSDIKQIDNRNNANILKWYVTDKDGRREYTPRYTAEMDYLIVRSEEYTYDAPVVYTLELPATNEHPEYLIARFEVEFVDIERQGPTSKTIITQQRINTQYKNLAEINFNNTTSHLPWEQASYGYVYNVAPLNTNGGYKRGASQGAFPFYGEYTILESVDTDWARASAHGGTGKSLYVDGTMEPGLVASITAQAKICSGQTMYCSAWFCNPAPSGWSGEGNPIFRCNIQGKNKDEQGWHDAGVYFVGELLKGSGWQQIVFPIQSASSYDSTRVSIYNFATTNQGNDFMVDDITLFVSQLPIAAYQGEMACRTVEDGQSSAVAVLRLDYNNITAGSDGYMFYQIYNESYKNKENGEVVSTGAAVNLTGDAGYYHDYDDEHGDLDHDHPYGSVHIPEKGFDPEVYNKTAENKVLIHTSVSAFLDDLVLNNQKHGKAYIRTEQSGVIKWLLYIAHIVENATLEDINKAPEKDKDSIPLKKLFDEHSYVMRMAYTPEELPTAECNLTTPLHATQQTVFLLRNSEKATIKHSQDRDKLIANNSNGDIEYIFSNSTQNCPNDLYFLTSTVVNHLSLDGAGGQTRNIAAPIFSDWLIGDPQGDVLSEKAPSRDDYGDDTEYQDALNAYNARLQAAVAGFKKMYGYTHDEVTSAIMYDMRRHTTDDPNSREYNPNYSAKTFEELQPNRFLSHENYEIVKHLYENGWLQLCDTTVHFYLGTRLDKEGNTIGDTVRYWCFPIAETAKTIVDVAGKATEITIKDCNEPHRVTVSIAGGDHYMNIAPITYAKKTPQQHVQIPTIKVLEGNYTITIPIKESDNTTALGVSSGNISIDLEHLGTDCSFYNLKTGRPSYDKPSLSPGTEHTIRIMLKDETNKNTHIGGDQNNCRVGYVFATIQIVPKTLVWQPTGNSFNGWGKNENWKGWKDTNSNNQIDEGELVEGFVPISETNVIIPQLDNSLLYPYIVPEHDHNHYELTTGYDPHHCDSIYFAPGTRIHNQHLLEYKRAFVDMQITAGSWHMMSAPLKGMVSGDMFIPHNGWYSENQNNLIAEPDPFVVSGFQGIRHADAAYAFWEGFYNTTVSTVTANGAVDHTASAEFIKSNTLAQALTPGSGYQLYGLGWQDKEELIIRLPKPDEQYSYYVDGAVSGKSVTIPESAEVRGKLAYESRHGEENDPMVITLTNDVASPYFLFGNPTMAYIDMHALYVDNKGSWTGNFQGMANSAWRSATQLTMIEDRYLPPMTSVLLESTEANTSMTINLKPSHLTLNNMVNPTEQADEDNTGTQSITARRIAAYESERPENEDAQATEMLTVYAITKNAHARTVVATNPIANDYYQVGEDALFISTGVENISEVKSPLNMYTVAEQVPMMADVRQGISSIPVAILAADNARQEYMQLAFYFTSNWSRTCYFVDHKTGQKVRIMNGLIISIEMPLNHEQRYSIEGPDTYQGSDGVVTSTTQPNLSTTGNKVWAYAPDRSTVVVSSSDLIKSATLYDITGRLITQSPIANSQSPNNLITNTLTLHTTGTAGMYIVDVTLRDGSTEQAQVIVQ